MATYALQGPAHAGAVLTLSAPGGTSGDIAPTGQGIGLLCSAGTTATVTVVLPIAPTYDGLAVTARSFVLTSNQIGLIPLPDSVYGPGTTSVTYTNVTSITVAAMRIP